MCTELLPPLSKCKNRCLSYLECAAAACDSSSRKDVSDVEQLQDYQVVQLIAGIKGRDGVDVNSRLELVFLHKKRKDQWLSHLMRFLDKD